MSTKALNVSLNHRRIDARNPIYTAHQMVLYTEKAPYTKVLIKSNIIDITDPLFIIKTKYRSTEQLISDTSHI